MQPHDKAEFLQILNGLAAIKPNAKLTREGLKVWWLAMESWTIEEFRAAAGKLASLIEFMPSPYHFDQLKKAARPTAGEAFARAVGHAASSGYRYGPLGDELVDRAVRALGGYVVIAMCDEDKLPFLERRFSEHYEAIQDAVEVRQDLPAIADQSRGRVSGPVSVKALLS